MAEVAITLGFLVLVVLSVAGDMPGHKSIVDAVHLSNLVQPVSLACQYLCQFMDLHKKTRPNGRVCH
jgi:hypothetical protein